MPDQTIFALASAPGRAGIAVVRVSGPDAGDALVRLAGFLPGPRRVVRARIRDENGETLDEALVIWFPGPASFTGEDVCEFHLHGSRAVIAEVLTALGHCPGLRPAEAGEFSRRAFAHGKLDLTAAEGLADLIEAETMAQRRQALRQMQGGLRELYDGWRARLIAAQAQIEAAIDFADEDLPGDLEAQARASAVALGAEIERHLDDGRRGERLRDGIEVAIVGPPNAGKSSLLNALVGRSAAIVSPHPGTTRDVIEVAIDLGGYPILLCDTAGLRAGGEPVEREGVARALQRAAAAAIRLVVVDGALWPVTDAETMALADDKADADSLVVVNKADLLDGIPGGTILCAGGHGAIAVSAATGSGLQALVDALTARVAARFDVGAASGPAQRAAPALTRVRHRLALEACRDALDRSATAAGAEVCAEDLRLAADALGRITGRVDVEEVLERIFRDFCIGK